MKKSKYCSCWCEYPNENLKFKNGNWRCIDNYKCIRPIEYKYISNIDTYFPKHKTKCILKESEDI